MTSSGTERQTERRGAVDYFGVALEVLAELGPDALTIAELCRRLELTKGSFYHHFGSMPAFVDDLLEFWQREHSQRLIDAAGALGEPVLQLTAMKDYAVALPHPSEAAIRAWARSNARVARAVAAVDELRDRALVEALQALGVPPPRADVIAALGMSVLVGVQTRDRPVRPDRLAAMFDEVMRLALREADPALLSGADGH
ncbi:TetR/AcrR family transcriptional regulator [Jatrophihabitans fulvus]